MVGEGRLLSRPPFFRLFFVVPCLFNEKKRRRECKVFDCCGKREIGGEKVRGAKKRHRKLARKVVAKTDDKACGKNVKNWQKEALKSKNSLKAEV